MTAITIAKTEKKSKSVKIDYFLYSCFEFEETCRSTPGRSVGSERWPKVVSYVEGHLENFTELGDLEKQVEAAIAWYVERFPALKNERRLDLANLSEIIPGMVFFALDLKTLCRVSEEIDEISYDDSVPETPVWKMLDKVLSKHMGDLQHHLVTYLKWSYAQKKQTHWEVGSRPPVGKYAPSMRRGNTRNNPNDKGGRPDRPSRGGPNSRGGNQQNRGGPPPRGRGGNRNEGGGRDRDNNRRNGPPSRSPQQTQFKEKQALSIVEDAVKELKSNPDLSEIQLPPANSFYRRLQHKHVITMGFSSQSTGDGNDRAVVVCRSKKSAASGDE